MGWRGGLPPVYVDARAAMGDVRGMAFLAIWQARLRLGLVALLLVTTLVTLCLAGPVGIYLALAAALASLLYCFDGPMLAAALRDWGVRCFIAAFFILWIAFVAAAESGNDMMAFVDFLALPVVVPAYALVARYAGPRSIAIVTALAGLGCTAALTVALYETRVLGAERAAGGTSPIFFSNMSVVLAFFALWGLVALRTRWRWLALAAFAFGMGAAILGGTRGSMLAAAALLCGFMVYALVCWKQPLVVRVATALAVVIGSLCFLFIAFDMRRMMTIATNAVEFANLGMTMDGSVNRRLMLYTAGVQSFLSSPIFGHGWWDRFMAAHPFLPPLLFDHWINDRTAHLHNDVLNFASAAGVAGIVAYCVMMAAPVVSALRSPRTERWALRVCAALGFAFGYIAMGLTDTMFVFEIPKSMYCLGAVIIMAFFLDAPPVAVPR